MKDQIPSLDNVLAILKNRKPGFEAAYGVTAIEVFGSIAREEAKPDSDVDVVVKMKKADPFFKVHIKEELEDALHCPVDIVRFREGMNPFLKSKIEKEAIYA